jgi:hypothetical protein
MCWREADEGRNLVPSKAFVLQRRNFRATVTAASREESGWVLV